VFHITKTVWESVGSPLELGNPDFLDSRLIQRRLFDGHSNIDRLWFKPGKVRFKEMEAAQAAATSGNLKLLQNYRSRGISLRAVDERGCTLLHYAAIGNHVEVVRFLLSERCNPNAKSQEGQTPLHLAAQSGNELMVTVLFENGSGIDHTDARGVSFVY
jgi:hypothetical protein